MGESIWISTDDHVRGPFAPHGRFRVRFEQGIYVYEAQGPFNEETVAALAATRAEAMRRWPVAEGRGLVMAHWLDSVMMPPQAFRLFAGGYNHFARGSRHPLVAVAWVGSRDTEGLELMADRFRELYEGNGTRFALFTDAGEALAWLRSVSGQSMA